MDILQLSLLLSAIGGCWCWNQEQLDLFDLVENIGQSFYEILQVEEVNIDIVVDRGVDTNSTHVTTINPQWPTISILYVINTSLLNEVGICHEEVYVILTKRNT